MFESFCSLMNEGSTITEICTFWFLLNHGICDTVLIMESDVFWFVQSPPFSNLYQSSPEFPEWQMMKRCMNIYEYSSVWIDWLLFSIELASVQYCVNFNWYQYLTFFEMTVCMNLIHTLSNRCIFLNTAYNRRERERNATLIIDMNGATTQITDPAGADEPRKFTFDYSFWSHDGSKEDANGYYGPDTSHPNGKKFADQVRTLIYV